MATQGWVSTPNVRGTYDIIWTCLQTVGLCAWSSICVNVPSPHDGASEMLRDKFHFTLLSCLSPDLVFLLAYAQLQSARSSVKQFKASGHANWTLKHAFYADMGGVSVEPPGWKRFPVNAKQLHYLVQHGYMDFPIISIREIEGRSKIDGLGKLITIAQALFFTVTILARVVEGLAITTLELTTLGFVFCTLATSICWWHKPSDVQYGHLFKLSCTMKHILEVAGNDAAGVYRDTPLDFVGTDRWAGNVLWPFYVNILRKMKLFPDKHRQRPVQKLSSFSFPKPASRSSEVVVLWLGLLYAASFFAAWNFYFPSFIEQSLWRVIASVQCALSAVIGAFEICYFSWLRDPDNSTTWKDIEGPAHTTIGTAALWKLPSFDRVYNTSISKHHFYDVPLRSLLITTPLCAAYCICRWFLLLEDLIGLRSLPQSAYQTVNWTQYWPHF